MCKLDKMLNPLGGLLGKSKGGSMLNKLSPMANLMSRSKPKVPARATAPAPTSLSIN